MNLNANKFQNISRIVAGTAPLFPNDSILLCDTSTGAVNLTLLSIPANYWQTTWKLYIQDNSNNAGTNNITINAGSGQTINGASSVVINSNGGGAIVQISSNTTFAASFYPITPLASPPVAASSGNTIVVANCDNFSFDENNFQVTNPSGQKASVSTYDSGWQDLNGFEFYPIGINKPQARRIGKTIHFKGIAIVPLADGSGNLIPLTNSIPNGFYVNDAFADTFVGTSPSNGCSTNTDGSLTFNRNNSVIPVSLNLPSTPFDSSYSKDWVITNRVVKSSDANTGIAISTVLRPVITQSGLLTIATYKDVELSPYIPDSVQNGLGLGTLRTIIANVKGGYYTPDYRTMTNTYTFTVAAANALAGETYSNNGQIFTVLESIQGGTTLKCKGTGIPSSGTLTLVSTSGTGDATITITGLTAVTQSSTHSSDSSSSFNWDFSIKNNTNTFLFDIDTSDETKLGGFAIILDGLTAFANL